MYNTASELYDKNFKNYDADYHKLLNAKKDKLNRKSKPINLKLKYFDYDGLFTEEKLDEELNGNTTFKR